MCVIIGCLNKGAFKHYKAQQESEETGPTLSLQATVVLAIFLTLWLLVSRLANSCVCYLIDK